MIGPKWARCVAMPIYITLMVAFGVLGVLVALPVLKPAVFVSFTERTHLRPHVNESASTALLPPYLADMTGWQEMADTLAGVYWSLPAADREKAVIFGGNYGDASAVNVYRPDVPMAISGHQNYFFWGPQGKRGTLAVLTLS